MPLCSEILNYNENCPPVKNFRVHAITASSITLDWNNTGADEYELKITTDLTGWDSYFSTELTMYTFTNLNPETTYYFQIVSICGADFSDSIIFSVNTI